MTDLELLNAAIAAAESARRELRLGNRELTSLDTKRAIEFLATFQHQHANGEKSE